MCHLVISIFNAWISHLVQFYTQHGICEKFFKHDLKLPWKRYFSKVMGIPACWVSFHANLTILKSNLGSKRRFSSRHFQNHFVVNLSLFNEKIKVNFHDFQLTYFVSFSINHSYEISKVTNHIHFHREKYVHLPFCKYLWPVCFQRDYKRRKWLKSQAPLEARPQRKSPAPATSFSCSSCARTRTARFRIASCSTQALDVRMQIWSINKIKLILKK